MKNNFYKFTAILLSCIQILFLSADLSAQVVSSGTNTVMSVSGTVSAANNSEPLIGVSVGIQGTTIGTTTDVDGKYELQLASTEMAASDIVLEFTYIGYKTQVQPLNGRAVINVSLEEDSKVLGEVVAIGYGTARKSDFTGSVSSVKGSELTKVPTGSVGQAMQGKLAGVNIMQASGEPGLSPIIRIRGIGSYANRASEPLYVVDNQIIEDISWLNPNDVETIDVLKDASAIAIYGARGSNGVIMITTKKGKYNEAGRLHLSTYYGSQQVIGKIKLTNAREYAILSNEIAANDNRPPVFANPDSLGAGTDWQDAVFQDAPMYSISLAARGGGEKYTYSVSGEYFDQKGIIKTSGFNRISLRLNNEFKVYKFLKIGNNITYNLMRNDLAPDVVGNAYRADPTVISRNESGQYGNTSTRTSVANPVAQIDLNNNKRRANQVVGLIYAEVTILKGLTYRSNFGVDLWNLYARNFIPEYYVSPEQQNLENQLSLTQRRGQRWQTENTLSYIADIGDFNLSAVVGTTAQEDLGEEFTASRKNLLGVDEDQFYLDLGDVTTSSANSIGSSYSTLSYLGRVNLSYKQRYLLTASLRRDGSSRFGANNKYGNFPSMALAWRAIDEPFMKRQEVLTNLKLRTSFGVVGNDRLQGGDYPYSTQVTTGLNTVFGINGQEYLINGATLTSLSNPDIRWESARQFDMGLEMGFWSNRVSVEVDYFHRYTDDLILNVPIPKYIGADNNPPINTGAILNEGLEFTAGIQGGRKLLWSLSGNASYLRNTVKKMGEGLEYIYDGGLGVGGLLGTRTVVGQPIGTYYGYQVLGIFQNQADLDRYPRAGSEVPGDLIYADINGDGVITDKDRTALGDNIPDFAYGISGRIDFLGIDISADMFGMSGFEVINSKKMARFNTPNFEVSYLDRWTAEGTSNSEPRVTNGGHNYEFSSRFVEKGDFLRLRSVSIGYTLPRKWMENASISNFRIYVSGTNLKTWSRYSGYTSEIMSQSPIDSGIDRGIYPLQKVYAIGLNCSF